MAEARQKTLALLQGFTQLGNAQKLGFILGLAAFISIIVGEWLSVRARPAPRPAIVWYVQARLRARADN